MQNQPAPLPQPPLPKSPLQGCGKGCTTALVIIVILLVIFWVIGNNEMRRDEYRAHPPSAGGRDYRRTEPGYDANAPLLPKDKDDIGPLYNEVERRKKEQGISGAFETLAGGGSRRRRR
jgi:hypothetical protein